jgi:hypothetical protein
VKSNHATAKKVVERLPMEGEEGDDEEDDADADDGSTAEDDGNGRDRDGRGGPDRSTALGSRDNFWGG